MGEMIVAHDIRHGLNANQKIRADGLRRRDTFCGHESDDVGDIYETPTIEDMAEELKKFPRYEID